MTRTFLVLAVGVAAGGNIGCTGLEPAVIGAVASGTQAGSAVYGKGRISAAAIADYDRSRRAVRAAAEDLSLEIYYEREGEVWSRYSLRDDLKKKFHIYVRRRSDTMTQVDIDVGRFGNEAIGRLLLMRLGVHMPTSGLGEMVGETNGSSMVADPDHVP